MSIFKRLLSALFALVVTFSPSGGKNPVPDATEHVHKYAETVTYATCTEQGYTTYTCACGDTYDDNFIDALGHSYMEAITMEVSCTEDGLKTFTCSICGDAYSEAIHAVGHSYEDVVTAPTCGVAGYTTHTCTSCGDSYIDSELPALEHYYSRTEYQEETCTEAGYKIFTCDHCGDSYKTILDPYHPSDRVWHDPTCEEEGYYIYTCIVCGYTRKDDFVPAVGHSYEASVTVPTCEERGYTTYTCTCGDSYIDHETDATGHSFVETITREPTQCMTGEKTFTCETCGYSYCEEIEVENKHSYVQVSVTEPTCTTEGIVRYECEFCTDWYTEAIPVNENNHNYTATVTEPTCTSAGYTTLTCSCGDSYTDSETEAIGHTWGGWIVTKEADEDVEGTKERKCNNCGETEIALIPVIHYHNYVKTSETEANCTDDGVIYRTCTGCGDVIHSTVEEALGHDWESHYQAEVGHYEAYIYCHCGNWCYRVADGNYDLAFADHVDADHDSAWWDWSYYSRNVWVVDVAGYNYKVCTRCGEEQ